MKKLMLLGLFAAFQSGGRGPRQQWRHRVGPFPRDDDRMAALQNGAKLFVNYCLNCHAAAFMRYNRLRDIGLTEARSRTT